MVIEINKDIDRYKESVVMGLTAKQLIFSVASVAAGGGIVLLLYRYIGLTPSVYVAIPVAAPIALGGFYSFNGMGFYEYMGRKMRMLFANRPLAYVSTEGEEAIRQIRMEEEAAKKTDKRKAGKKTAGKRKTAKKIRKAGNENEKENSESSSDRCSSGSRYRYSHLQGKALRIA